VAIVDTIGVLIGGFALEIETRWMRRSDTADAIRIMNSCGGDFDERGVDRLVSKAGVVCVVAEVDGKVVGVLAYDISRVSKIKVISLSVEDASRRRGVGRALMELVSAKLNRKRSKIELSVSEYNLGAQLFLRSMGFRAVSVLDSGKGSSDYKFLYRLEEPTLSDS
jgi:ribosomal protein S18 acetylase RimI-like enzyme